jgi:hypothetical protein
MLKNCFASFFIHCKKLFLNVYQAWHDGFFVCVKNNLSQQLAAESLFMKKPDGVFSVKTPLLSSFTALNRVTPRIDGKKERQNKKLKEIK